MNDAANVVETHCAHWGHNDHRYFGNAVFGELTGKETFTGLVALSILGRRLPREHCEVLDDIACISTLADPRIWPLKITRLIAAYGAAMPAIAAGIANLQGAIVSPWQASEAAGTLEALMANVRELQVVKPAIERLFESERAVSGYGLPCRSVDERLVALRECIQRRGRHSLPYWSLLTACAGAVGPSRRHTPNIGLGIAAAMLDMGISRAEIGPLTCALFQHMLFANAVEGAMQAPRVLRQLPDKDVAYCGAEPRVSPRARGRHSVIRPISGQRSNVEGQIVSTVAR